MILATRHGDREMRAAGEWGTEHLIPPPDGPPVTAPTGLPAVGRAIRLYAGTIASFPIAIWQGERERRRRRDDAWQVELFGFPNDETNAYTFMWDIVTGLEACGNAFLFKSRLIRNGRVGALAILQPQNMTVRRDFDTSELVYEFWDGSKTRRLNPADVLHIRGDTLGGGDIGFSPITVHRASLGKQTAREEFEGRHYLNDARPGVALMFPQGVNRQQAKEWADDWDTRHAGPHNRGRTGVLGGGATLQTFPLSLEDQQYVETSQFGVREVARMYDVPATLLEEGEADNSEQEWLRWLKSGLASRLNRIEGAFRADPDLFGRGQPLYPEFDPDAFMRTDAVSMAQMHKEYVQSGIWLVNESRARQGMGPLPPVPENPNQDPGNVPQIVPVGGQANPGSPPPQE